MPALAERRGDFDQWYAARIGWSHDRFHVVDAVNGEILPKAHNVDGLIISGSAHCVQDYAPWSVKAGQWIADVVEAGIPTLGICYGHQLIADEFGGQVGVNPEGREIGVSWIEKTREDPLFEGLPNRFLAIQTHVDAVLRAPDFAEVIGSNSVCSIQAMAVGDTTRTVQWHPEFDTEVIAHYINVRREIIDEESGAGHADELLASLKEVDTGTIILRNFVDHFLGGY
jgi:GMP synthase (glutamine-hydrolysing)